MKLEVGRSYLSHFFAFFVCIIVVAIATVIVDSQVLFWAMCTSIPGMFLMMVISEIRSGVALDGYWRADIPHPGPRFWPHVVLHIVGFLASALMLVYSFAAML